MSGKRVNWIDVIEGRADRNIFYSAIGPELNGTGLKRSNATPPKAEIIELGTDPSLALDIFWAARKLEGLLNYTPQYAEALKVVRELKNIEVTDEQQKRYEDVERIAKDIIQRVREKEKKEEKDLPVIGRMTVVRDNCNPRQEKKEEEKE